MPAQPEAFFLSVDGGRLGQRFCLFHPAQGGVPKGCVLYIHPFAEEMNKSRRMAALQARALAKAGYAVLQIDLFGCGDSSGDFGDASWQDWVGDVVQGSHWLRSRTTLQGAVLGSVPLWLWGLRAGCLLAAEAATHLTDPCNFLFWQPPSSGKPLLQQFLRLKVAGAMLGGTAKGLAENLRQQLAAGATIDVAGYLLSPGLAMGLDLAVLAPPGRFELEGTTARLEWFEMSAREDAALSPVSHKATAQWGRAGFAVRSHIVTGPSFWQTSEIEQSPALIDATIAGLAQLEQTAAA